MTDLAHRIQAMNMILAPSAIPHQGTLGRLTEEPGDDTRTPFQRDRDRIIHSQAFRRLQGKTQVFVAGEGDHFRSRLTHTMEVAQIARDCARTLQLNEDVAESIALAHDLGHPPFGHRGETALDAWMQEHGGHFEHNEQSLRIVTLLEDHSLLFRGLNLNREILDGLQKHAVNALVEGRRLSLEAQLVNLADEIAYCAHDCDDGLRAGLFSIKDLEAVALVREAMERAALRKTSLRGGLIHLLVHDLYATTSQGIRELNLVSIDDVYGAPRTVVDVSPAMREKLTTLLRFLWDRMYSHERVTGAGADGQLLLRELCERFFRAPTEKVLELQKKTGSTLPETVKDYVAGMTDAFAIAIAKRD